MCVSVSVCGCVLWQGEDSEGFQNNPTLFYFTVVCFTLTHFWVHDLNCLHKDLSIAPCTFPFRTYFNSSYYKPHR